MANTTIGSLRKQYDYRNTYAKENYDRLSVVVKKGKRDIIKDHAAGLGMSISEYINNLIDKDLGLSK